MNKPTFQSSILIADVVKFRYLLEVKSRLDRDDRFRIGWLTANYLETYWLKPEHIREIRELYARARLQLNPHVGAS